MARGQRFTKPTDSSVFGKVIDGAIEDASKLLNAIEFIESPQGLNIKLYPLQRLIVKCIFAVPIDFAPIKVQMWDVFRENPVRECSEEECLHILHEEGRCNVNDWRDMPERGFTEAAIFAGRRGGKMLHVDEPIPTPDGCKRNGDLEEGDAVFGEDGQVYKVKYAHPVEELEAFKVSFDDGTHVFAHGGHLWNTLTKVDRKAAKCSKHAIGGTTRTTEELLATLRVGKKQETNHCIPLAKAVTCPDIDLLLDPYCLGVWLGDGNSDCGIITAAPEDADKILPYFESAGMTFYQNEKAPTRWHVLGLFSPLRQLGVLKNKHIPHQYLWASEPQRLSLLQGLMDTDGSLAEGVYHLAASLGLKPYWGEGRAILNDRDCGEKYRVTWTGTLPVFRLPRKLAELPSTVNSTQKWRFITDIQPVGRMPMRCITTTNPTSLYLFGKNFNVTHNSQVVSAIGAYKLYKLLNIRSPQEYFGLIAGSHIDFTFMAQDEEGANRLYDKLREDINRAPFFNPYLKASSSSWMGFVSEADRHKRDVTPSINVKSYASTTNAVRGPSNIFLALDEFAHFRSSKGSSSDEVYGAATPSTVNFKHAEDLKGGWVDQLVAAATMKPEEYKSFQDSLVLSISSPWTKVGKMFDIHKDAMERGAKETKVFTIRLSTAEMNPTILSETLRSEYTKNPLTFKAEYGGNFLESSESYLTEAQIQACTDVKYVKTNGGFEEPDETSARFNLSHFHPKDIGRQYFWAIDLGMSHDATAVAIGHLEYVGGSQPIHLVYDYIDRMMVGEKFEGPGVGHIQGLEKYVGFKALPLEDILAWLKALNVLMPCWRGATDQHGGQQLVQLLELNKIHNIELVNLTATLNSQMAFVLQGYVRDTRCRFPYVPKFLKELRLVEAEYVNKYQIRVAAPLEKGSHDDMVDAAQLCAWKAQKWLMEEGGLKIDPSGQSLLIAQQMNLPSGAIINMDGVILRDLQILERMRKIQRITESSMGDVVRNPFHRRGR